MSMFFSFVTWVLARVLPPYQAHTAKSTDNCLSILYPILRQAFPTDNIANQEPLELDFELNKKQYIALIVYNHFLCKQLHHTSNCVEHSSNQYTQRRRYLNIPTLKMNIQKVTLQAADCELTFLYFIGLPLDDLRTSHCPSFEEVYRWAAMYMEDDGMDDTVLRLTPVTQSAGATLVNDTPSLRTAVNRFVANGEFALAVNFLPLLSEPPKRRRFASPPLEQDSRKRAKRADAEVSSVHSSDEDLQPGEEKIGNDDEGNVYVSTEHTLFSQVSQTFEDVLTYAGREGVTVTPRVSPSPDEDAALLDEPIRLPNYGLTENYMCNSAGARRQEASEADHEATIRNIALRPRHHPERQ
ncbi:hypothetical protein C7974DRAFT_370820 [Boeremia exigua]|uniref:uncharacterized protein n=1 Tax=Boeremia exigua TaxID=749465 RepID=UPI001E8E4AAE|nr:uncharacterized protein C7974DRAFT_370820 [Boeremia exigua]KAH6643591.1 hypothetical protein C7974DRAFT_370820 [Boeremia exigua]